MNRRAVYLQAHACLSALGSDAATMRATLFADAPGGLRLTDAHSPGRALMLGLVDTPLPSLAEGPYASPPAQRSRNNALLAGALERLRPAVDAALARVGPARVAIVLGTSTAGLDEGRDAAAARQAGAPWPADFDYALQEMGSPAAWLAAQLGTCGPTHVISTACSSGAKALASGARLLRAGLADLVIAGGVDALSSFTVAGFSALEAVSAERCNPLAAARRGINLGEGAALFLMGCEGGPVRLSGWGESSDAHHMSAPDPSGRGAARAIAQALQRAGLGGADIDYVNLHGTATPHNDAMEALALAQAAPGHGAVSSTKPLTGHALAAAGAVEAAIAWQVLVDNPRGRLPPHWFDGTLDPALPALRPVPPGAALGRPVRHVLSNSFAFGGSNAALILSRE